MLKKRVGLIVGLVAGLASSCTNDKGLPQNGKTEKKPTTVGEDDLQVKDDAPVSKVAEASYDIAVTSRSGASLCLGSASIEIDSNFAMKFPAAKLSCVSLTIDLAKVLGATQASVSNEGMSSDGKMIYMETFGSAKFEPARPFLVGPVIQDPSDYEGYTKNGDYTVSFQNGGVSDTKSGKINIKVIETNGKYESSKFDKKLDKVMHWQMTTTGFEGVPVANTFLFDKIEFYWNTRPIMVPKIVIEGFLGDFISQSDGKKGALNIDDVIGKIRLELTVTKFDTF